MRQNILKVIDAFKAGQAANGATCSTDGNVIYSYNMPIVWREGDMGLIIIASYRSGPSRTTRAQIQACSIELSNYNVIRRDVGSGMRKVS